MKNQFLLSLTANGGRVFLGFVFFWQVSQALGLSTLGEYLYISVAIGYFGTLVDYGFNLFVLNTAPRAPGAVRALLARVVLSKLILTGAAFFILAALYGVAFATQGALVTALFFAVVILQSFSGLLVQFFKAMDRFDHEFTSIMLGSLMPVVILFVLQGNVTLVELGWVVLNVRLAVLLFQLVVFFYISQGQGWKEVEDMAGRRLPRAVKDIQSNFKYAIFSILGAVFLSVDLVVMRFVLGPEDVAIYGTAMKVIMAVILFFEVLTGVFVPRLARLHSNGSTLLASNMKRFTLVMLAGALMVSAGLLSFGSLTILWVFGAEFAAAGQVLQALSIVLVFRVMTTISGTFLTIHGQQSLRARIISIVLPVHVGLNLVLQPQFGIWGAVTAITISFLLWFGLNLLGFWRYRSLRAA
ncbi:polysaccharide biosynthesis C-terminal domain-containing protein [Roseibacterium sp. SDUM158016]|uniref:oligosaccharide flippase family protein n=1 Tax=Roseicyclus sediminis TaxID=2980997 RepID=UPI0021D13ED4|nr:polysaccharide biosynthesis C-terminal domain-containing protein [Roseibacterium sp. SDUM158016]MCU4653753.1 polysaccharide biosynthesis C-terminal domain-containing protein [Roseibacterium sp. SDUM158016]